MSIGPVSVSPSALPKDLVIPSNIHKVAPIQTGQQYEIVGNPTSDTNQLVQDCFASDLFWAKNPEGLVIKDSDGQLIYVPPRLISWDTEVPNVIALDPEPLHPTDVIPPHLNNRYFEGPPPNPYGHGSNQCTELMIAIHAHNYRKDPEVRHKEAIGNRHKAFFNPEKIKAVRDRILQVGAKAEEIRDEVARLLAEQYEKIKEKFPILNIDPNTNTSVNPSELKLAIDFTKGMVNGLLLGGKDSLTNLGHLGAELIKHPIDTTLKIIDSLKELSELALTDQWAELCEALCPEARKLAEEWSSLSSKERGELFGHAVGSLATDIIVPAKLAKLAAKGVKGAQKLFEISKGITKAEPVFAIQGGAALGEVFPPNRAVAKIVFGEGNFTVEKLLEAGNAVDRQGLTKAGRGLAKHGGRDSLVFPKPTGNPAEINIQGKKILEKILKHPEKEIIIDNLPRYGDHMIISSPEGGVRFSIDGEFIGFLEPT